MTRQEATDRLRPALNEEATDTFCFASSKVFLLVKLFNIPTRLRFGARDHVVFQLDEEHFVVADSSTGRTCRAFDLPQIENLTAGEPECDNDLLFQG